MKCASSREGGRVGEGEGRSAYAVERTMEKKRKKPKTKKKREEKKNRQNDLCL